MIKKAGSIFIILFLLISVLSSFSLEAEAEEGSITIAVNTANIRKGPSLSDPVVGQAKRGETFTYSQKKYDWYEIQLSNGEKGWLAGWLVKQQTHVTASAHKEGIINADGLRLRSGPGEHHSVIGTLKSEEKVQIIGEQDYWYQISSSAGKGYVHMDYVKSAASGQATESDTIEEINLPSASKGTITGDRLNVRKEPVLSSTILGKLQIGDTVTVTGVKNGWAQIEFAGSKAWISENFIRYEEKVTAEKLPVPNGEIVVLYNGTNVRSNPSTNSSVVKQVSQGESYPILEREGKWFKIALNGSETAYIASWVVSVKSESASNSNNETPPANKEPGLKGKTIILDPGHGGRDGGTIGSQGTVEKFITMKTAQLLYDKLQQAGANVILTRSDDRYMPLPSRVAIAHYYDADAFISIHYDSIPNGNTSGFTTYYHHSNQKKLATNVHQELDGALPVKDRGIRNGDYHVIRENRQPAILLELGFLSNPQEESLVVTTPYQELVTNGIYNGLNSYFSN